MAFCTLDEEYRRRGDGKTKRAKGSRHVSSGELRVNHVVGKIRRQAAAAGAQLGGRSRPALPEERHERRAAVGRRRRSASLDSLMK